MSATKSYAAVASPPRSPVSVVVTSPGSESETDPETTPVMLPVTPLGSDSDSDGWTVVKSRRKSRAKPNGRRGMIHQRGNSQIPEDGVAHICCGYTTDSIPGHEVADCPYRPPYSHLPGWRPAPRYRQPKHWDNKCSHCGALGAGYFYHYNEWCPTYRKAEGLDQ